MRSEPRTAALLNNGQSINVYHAVEGNSPARLVLCGLAELNLDPVAVETQYLLCLCSR